MSLAETPMIWNGQGPVHIGRYDPVNGRPEMGYLVDVHRVGCGTSVLSTTAGRDTTIIPESCSGQRLALKEIETSKSLNVTLTMVQFDSRTLAAAFYGNATEVAGTSVTDEELAELADGDTFFLYHPRVSNVVIKDGASSANTYVEGTHYEIEDADHGRLRLIEHHASYEKPLKVDYEYETYLNTPAFSASNVERGLIFSGINGDGQKQRVIIPRISLAMNGDFNWIVEQAADLSLSGAALFVDRLQTDPRFGPFMRIDSMPDLPVVTP